MDILKTIKDEDIGSNTQAPEVYKERKASRAIVFDTDKNVALLHASKKSYHKLPGGVLKKRKIFMRHYDEKLSKKSAVT